VPFWTRGTSCHVELDGSEVSGKSIAEIKLRHRTASAAGAWGDNDLRRLETRAFPANDGVIASVKFTLSRVSFSNPVTFFNMPSYSSPSPPIASRAIDDARSSPGAQAPLTPSPSAHKTSSVLVPAKSTPATKVDSGPTPVAKEVGQNFVRPPALGHRSRTHHHPSSGLGAVPPMRVSTEKCSTRCSSSTRMTNYSQKTW
jgi:hypothetical protein